MKDLSQDLKNLKCANKTWFYRFLAMFEESNVNAQTIEKALNLILDNDNQYGVIVGTDNIFLNNPKATKCIESFFAYMAELALSEGTENFKKILENIIEKVETDFLNIKNEGAKIKTNFFYLFMRELLLQKPEDIQINWNIKNGNRYEGRLDFVLAGVSLAYLSFAEEPANVKLVVYDDFRTLPGLEKLGVGSHMFVELCKKVVEDKPGYSIMACGVLKGKDGEKAYSSWGGYPIDPKSNNRCWIINEKPLTAEEYNKASNFIMYYFSNKIVAKNASKQNVRYGAQDYKNNFIEK